MSEPQADEQADARGSARNALRSVTSGISRVGTRIGTGVADQTSKVVGSTLDDLHGLMPLLEESGFAFGGIELELAMSPSLTVRVHRTTGDPAALDALLQSGANLSRTQRTIISSLRRAYALEDTIMGAHFRIVDVRIKLGVPPSVSLILGPQRGDDAPGFDFDGVRAASAPPPAPRRAPETTHDPTPAPAPAPPAERRARARPTSRSVERDDATDADVSLGGLVIALIAIGLMLFLAAAAILAVIG